MAVQISRVLSAAIALLAAIAAGCSRPPSAPPALAGPPRVVVTIPPLAGLVQPLLPPGTAVRSIISGAQSEHGYELTTGDVAALSSAEVVVYVGLGLEPQVESFLRAHPNSHRQTICFADAVGLKAPAGAEHHDEPTNHDDHEDDGHYHGPIEPHLWLDPELVAKFIPSLAEAIAAADTQAVRDRAKKLTDDLAAFDAESKAKLAPFAGRAIVTHHAAWGRFAEHYSLRVAAVLRPIETSETTPADINAAVAAITNERATAIFVEPQFNADAARRIADLTGVKVGTLDPLGTGDWFAMMRSNVDTLVKTLGH
jgi:ABC-type Zn uptake system ZnuABC Zn-binding protein ZnuA